MRSFSWLGAYYPTKSSLLFPLSLMQLVQLEQLFTSMLSISK